MDAKLCMYVRMCMCRENNAREYNSSCVCKHRASTFNLTAASSGGPGSGWKCWSGLAAAGLGDIKQTPATWDEEGIFKVGTSRGRAEAEQSR